LAVLKLYLTTLHTLNPGSSVSNISTDTPANKKMYPLITVQSHLSIYSHYLDIITFQKLTECPTVAKVLIRINILVPIILKFGF